MRQPHSPLSDHSTDARWNSLSPTLTATAYAVVTDAFHISGQPNLCHDIQRGLLTTSLTYNLKATYLPRPSFPRVRLEALLSFFRVLDDIAPPRPAAQLLIVQPPTPFHRMSTSKSHVHTRIHDYAIVYQRPKTLDTIDPYGGISRVWEQLTDMPWLHASVFKSYHYHWRKITICRVSKTNQNATILQESSCSHPNVWYTVQGLVRCFCNHHSSLVLIRK